MSTDYCHCAKVGLDGRARERRGSGRVQARAIYEDEKRKARFDFASRLNGQRLVTERMVRKTEKECRHQAKKQVTEKIRTYYLE